MDDLQMHWIAELFIYHEVREQYGWTFAQFIAAYELGTHERLLKQEAV